MAHFDLPQDQLAHYRPELAVPDDLGEFWSTTLAEARTFDVDVTLSADLLRRLRAEARELGVPLSWLVASLIVDTVDSLDGAGSTIAA